MGLRPTQVFFPQHNHLLTSFFLLSLDLCVSDILDFCVFGISKLESKQDIGWKNLKRTKFCLKTSFSQVYFLDFETQKNL